MEKTFQPPIVLKRSKRKVTNFRINPAANIPHGLVTIALLGYDPQWFTLNFLW